MTQPSSTDPAPAANEPGDNPGTAPAARRDLAEPEPSQAPPAVPLLTRVQIHVGELLRFVYERPCTLPELVALARDGAWTTARGHSQLRHLALLHVRVVQLPVLVLGTFLAWAARTPGRLWTVLPLTLTVLTALDQIPILNILIPEWLTWHYWPPFCWIF